MMMSDSFLCCDSCFEKIGKYSVKSAKLWIDLCAIYTYEQGVFEVIFDDEMRLSILEKLGYIETTDVQNGIRVKVKGLRLDHIGLYYCPNGCEAVEEE